MTVHNARQQRTGTNLDTHDGQRTDQGADANVDEDRLVSLPWGQVEDQHTGRCCARYEVQQEACHQGVNVSATP